MERKAAVEAVTCRKVKETDKTDWILSNYTIKIYAKIRSRWPCRTLLGPPLFWGGIIISAVCFSVPPVAIAPSSSKVSEESAAESVLQL